MDFASIISKIGFVNLVLFFLIVFLFLLLFILYVSLYKFVKDNIVRNDLPRKLRVNGERLVRELDEQIDLSNKTVVNQQRQLQESTRHIDQQMAQVESIKSSLSEVLANLKGNIENIEFLTTQTETIDSLRKKVEKNASILAGFEKTIEDYRSNYEEQIESFNDRVEEDRKIIDATHASVDLRIKELGSSLSFTMTNVLSENIEKFKVAINQVFNAELDNYVSQYEKLNFVGSTDTLKSDLDTTFSNVRKNILDDLDSLSKRINELSENVKTIEDWRELEDVRHSSAMEKIDKYNQDEQERKDKIKKMQDDIVNLNNTIAELQKQKEEWDGKVKELADNYSEKKSLVDDMENKIKNLNDDKQVVKAFTTEEK